MFSRLLVVEPAARLGCPPPLRAGHQCAESTRAIAFAPMLAGRLRPLLRRFTGVARARAVAPLARSSARPSALPRHSRDVAIVITTSRDLGDWPRPPANASRAAMHPLARRIPRTSPIAPGPYGPPPHILHMTVPATGSIRRRVIGTHEPHSQTGPRAAAAAAQSCGPACPASAADSSPRAVSYS